MSWDAALPRFASIGDFYAERGGERSGESDFGCWWFDWPRELGWRVSAVEQTGDLYAIHPRGRVVLIGCVGPDPGYEKAHELLDGWEHKCGELGSLAWAVERAAATLGVDKTCGEVENS